MAGWSRDTESITAFIAMIHCSMRVRIWRVTRSSIRFATSALKTWNVRWWRVRHERQCLKPQCSAHGQVHWGVDRYVGTPTMRSNVIGTGFLWGGIIPIKAQGNQAYIVFEAASLADCEYMCCRLGSWYVYNSPGEWSWLMSPKIIKRTMHRRWLLQLRPLA